MSNYTIGVTIAYVFVGLLIALSLTHYWYSRIMTWLIQRDEQKACQEFLDGYGWVWAAAHCEGLSLDEIKRYIDYRDISDFDKGAHHGLQSLKKLQMKLSIHGAQMDSIIPSGTQYHKKTKGKTNDSSK